MGVAAAAPGLLAACTDEDTQPGDPERGTSTLDRAREDGFIRAGFANEAPYAFAEGGRLTGAAPEVARRVLGELGVPELSPVLTEFDLLIPHLQAGRSDIITAGMFITPENCEDVLFSDPDYCMAQAFGVPEGNPLDVHRYEDVAQRNEAVLGVLRGGVEEGYAKASGVSEDRIRKLDEIPGLLRALRNGDVNVVALTSVTIRRLVREDPGLQSTDPFVPTVDGEEQLSCGGYGFRKEDEGLRDAFNQVLADLQATDELLPLVEPFGFTEFELRLAEDRTAAELCNE